MHLEERHVGHVNLKGLLRAVNSSFVYEEALE